MELWGGKKVATFPNRSASGSSSREEEGQTSEVSGGSTAGKATRMAKMLAAKAAKVAKTRKTFQATRYYQAPPAIKGADGQPQRHKPGTISLAALRWYQKLVGMFILLLPFLRLVQELMEGQKKYLRFQSLAIKVLQERAEAYLISMLEGMQLVLTLSI